MKHVAIHPPAEALACTPCAHVLERAWRDLSEQSSLPTQSAEFLVALLATFLLGQEMLLLQVEGARCFDAVLPLVRRHGILARWRLAGDEEVFEPSDALYRDADASDRLARKLARESRPAVLARVPAKSAFIASLRKAMRGRGIISVRPATPCPTIPLDSGWTEPESKFSSRRRSDFRRAMRRAEEFGEVRFETIAPTEENFDALFDLAVQVEAASWKREAGSAIACDKVKEEFFRQYLRAAGARGECRISFLRLGGQVAAMHLAVEQGGKHWLYKIGFDEGFKRCSPGTLLMLHAIGEAAKSGCTAFEMMGDAESWIADFWTREEIECVQLRTYPFGWRGVAALLEDGFAWGRARLSGARK